MNILKIPINTDVLYSCIAVAFRMTSSVINQFFRFPLMKPAVMTNINTSILTLVNILLTVVDSFTPYARRAVRKIP